MSNKASKRVREDPEAISAEEQDNPPIKEAEEQEYWSPDEPFDLPKTVSFEYKSDTDLYEFKKVISKDYQQFVTMSIDDRQVRVFRFSTGKLTRKYDESLAVMGEMQQAGTTIYKLDDMEFGRRLAVERELEKTQQANTMNAGGEINWQDGTSSFFKHVIVSRSTKEKNDCYIGKYIHVFTYCYKNDIAMAASDNPLMKESEATDPTIFCTAFKRNRFFMFTQREPDALVIYIIFEKFDVYNEKPSREEQTVASATPTKQKLGNTAILRDGTGGESAWGSEFEDEFHRDLRHDRPYTVTTAGMDVIHTIENAKTDKLDKPFEDIKILNIEVR
ncbi:19824_t:CDS:2 [Racocetra fulgida]|uniref:19824_t:CDS:1 n=1 Tax=Racocetra fulgida TaxID=60492 RepID=A0A9N8VVW8_9GLOM|nr:19824_t:CDS:2 [Racocetra fulgida]